MTNAEQAAEWECGGCESFLMFPDGSTYAEVGDLIHGSNEDCRAVRAYRGGGGMTDTDNRPDCRYCGEPIDHNDYGEQRSRAHLPCRPPWRGNPGDAAIMPADTSK